MKITISFKTPDVARDAARETAESEAEYKEFEDSFEREAWIDERTDEVYDKLSQWISYGENVSIEFYIDSGEAHVLNAR